VSVFIGRVAPPPSALLFTLRASEAEVVNTLNLFLTPSLPCSSECKLDDIKVKNLNSMTRDTPIGFNSYRETDGTVPFGSTIDRSS